MSFIMNKLIKAIGMTLLCLMIVFGQVDSLIYLKIVMLLIVCGCILINVITSKCFPVDYEIIAITFIICTFGLISAFVGLSNNNPGAIEMTRIHVIWPLLYLLVVAGISSIPTLKS